MHPQKSRYVALCQQMLVLGAVGAALVPAAAVVNLDVVREHPAPGATAPSTAQTALAAYAAGADRATPVAAAATDAVVHQYALTGPGGAIGAASRGASASATSRIVPAVATRGSSAAGLHARVVADTRGTTTIVSDPQDVQGFGTVGVTWQHGQDIAEGDISFELRTRTDGDWSPWQELTYHDEHGPDDGSAEARRARPGTDEALVGHVDQVQVKAEVASDQVPSDLTLAVIDPGKATATTTQTPDIDTSELPVVPDAVPGADGRLIDPSPNGEPSGPAPAPTDSTETPQAPSDGLALAASTISATKPLIYSRAQWGADEKLREQSAPSYGTVHGGFVHHTVNANDYTAAEVPGIIRSIYAYHVKSRGWRDIGYNFLVDRFGRIWEGRYGGVDRNVIGAHTENYNGDSFGASAIGNFDIAQPTSQMIGAYGALFAWKLAINGVSAAATNVRIEGRVFASSIMGHRDTKSTACPGRYLYARIPDIRKQAAAAQRGLTFAPRNQNLVGTPHPDIIARRTSDKRGVIIPTTGASGFGATRSLVLRGGRSALLTPDVTGDGRADLLVLNRGVLSVRRGNGAGGFGRAFAATKQLRGRVLVTPVGDLNGDRRNDLVARDPATGRLTAYLGNGNGTFRAQRPLRTPVFKGYNLLAGGGDMTGDGRADIVGRDAAGVLWLHPGRGNGSFGARRSLGGGWQAYDGIVAADFTKDGRADLMVRRGSTKKAYVRVNTGTGVFSPEIGPYAALRSKGRLLGAANVLGDANADVMTMTGGRVDIIERSPGTDLGTPVVTNLDLRNATMVLNVGDWNGDGRGDVVYRERSGTTYLALGNGAGSFSGRYSFGTVFARASQVAAVGDMTGDGRPDLMAQTSAGLQLYPNKRLKGVGSPTLVHGAVAGTPVPVGRWDGDTTPDVFVRNGNTLTLYSGSGASGLSSTRTVAADLAPYDWVIGVGSLDVTGHSDLVARRRSDGALVALLGKSDGTLMRPRLLGSGFGGYDLAG